MRLVQGVLRIFVPHQCKLRQMLGRAVHRGADVEKNHVAGKRGQEGSNSRALDAFENAEKEKRRDDGGAGVPRADDGGSFAFFPELASDPNGGVAFKATDL